MAFRLIPREEKFYTDFQALAAELKRGARLLEEMGQVRKVLVISEDWCGTCLAEVPFVAKLVEGKPDIEMRFFPRDANPDLMDQYLKKGLYRSIPVFAFFDERMNEVARFIERRPG